ncbi:FHA domain-containing protein [Vreelandella titanicae]|uniref:SctD/MshK family protein n=1 Tax=Vreelandella titanicae TaxID=664683 RepID=UPI0039BFE39E
MTLFTSASASVREAVTTLKVIAGLHRGASITLTEPVCCIGSDDSTDVMLGDPGTAPHHIVLRFYGRYIAIEALGGDIIINGRSVSQGTGLRCELPAKLHFNDVALELSRPPAPAIFPGLPTVPVRWRKWLNRSATLAALVVTLGVLAFYEFIDVNQADANIGYHPVTATLDEQPLVNTGQNASQLMADARPGPVQALRQQLADAGLASLEVTDSGDYIGVSGQYDPDQVGAWNATQRWFDQHYGSHNVLLNEVKQREAPVRPDLQLQAVWLGKNPYVIDARGQRLYPGASLSSGWVISAIETDRVLLSRGDDQFALTL